MHFGFFALHFFMFDSTSHCDNIVSSYILTKSKCYKKKKFKSKDGDTVLFLRSRICSWGREGRVRLPRMLFLTCVGILITFAIFKLAEQHYSPIVVKCQMVAPN